MNYSLLIEERVSARAFQEKQVAPDAVQAIRAYHDGACMRLIPEIATEIVIAGESAKEALEKAAGYNEYLIGAPNYLVLLSEEKEHYLLNAGFIAEDLSLKLNELGIGVCFLTFTDSDQIKSALSISSEKKVAAILAFGYRERMKKKLHLNILTMSKITVQDKQHYFDPKKKIDELVSVDTYGDTTALAEKLDQYGEILWEAFRAAAASPSYLNLQPYSFLIKGKEVYLLAEPDARTDAIDKELNLGIVMLHFVAVASAYANGVKWTIPATEVSGLPDGVQAVAVCGI